MKYLLSLVILSSFIFAKIDINHASKIEFKSLNGIGVKKAESIVNYRTKHGCFRKLEDIMDVSGIGKGIFKKIELELEIIACDNQIKKKKKKKKENTNPTVININTEAKATSEVTTTK